MKGMPRFSRREFLLGAVATATAGAALPALAAGETLIPEHHEILVPDLDPAHDGLRVAQLSDLHVGSLTPVERIAAAIEAANRFRPDLVVLTGDYLTRDPGGVTLMREQLGGLEAPTLGTLGNHDRWVDPRGAGRGARAPGLRIPREREHHPLGCATPPSRWWASTTSGPVPPTRCEP